MKYGYIILFLSILSCNKAAQNESSIINFQATRSGSKLLEEKVLTNKIYNSDSIIFTYDYDKLHDGIDSLSINEGSVKLGKSQLEFVRSKVFKIHNEEILIDKYYLITEHPHGGGVYFLNKNLGLIAVVTMSDMVFEYAYDKNELLLAQLKIDSFFKEYD